jgi:hypothetical protein
MRSPFYLCALTFQVQNTGCAAKRRLVPLAEEPYRIGLDQANRFAKCNLADSVRADSYSMRMDSIIHTSCGVVSHPIRDNSEAQIELAFTRVYPHVRTGNEFAIWERSTELPTGPHTLRKLARQRAILESSRTTSHREAVGETSGERCEH